MCSLCPASVYTWYCKNGRSLRFYGEPVIAQSVGGCDCLNALVDALAGWLVFNQLPFRFAPSSLHLLICWQNEGFDEESLARNVKT